MSTKNYNTTFIENRMKLTLNVNGNSKPVEETESNEAQDSKKTLAEIKKVDTRIAELKHHIKFTRQYIAERFTGDKSEYTQFAKNLLGSKRAFIHKAETELHELHLRRSALLSQCKNYVHEIKFEKAKKLNHFEGALKKIKCGIENGKLDNEKILAIINQVLEENN